MQTCVVCIDGLDPKIADKYPNLSLDNKTTTSIEQPESILAWVEFYLGIHHAETGITEAQHPTGRDWTIWDIEDHNFWWHHTRLKRTRIGIVDMPIISSPAPLHVDGWNVGHKDSYPKDIPPLPPRFMPEDFPAGNLKFAWDHSPSDEEILQKIKNMGLFVHYQFTALEETVKRMLRFSDVDLLLIYASALDYAGHILLGYDNERLHRFYRRADLFIDALYRICVPKQLVVLSDHGMLPLPQDRDTGGWQERKVGGGTLWERRYADKAYAIAAAGHRSCPPGVLAATGIQVPASAVPLRDVGMLLAQQIQNYR